MEPTTLHAAKTSEPKDTSETAAKSENDPSAELAVETIELDRRGKPLPPRQRVGGIITPQ
jgi:hypothetical protein